MKYPLSKDEWKWLTVVVLFLTIVCLGLGLIINEITGLDIGLPLAGIVWIWFLYMYILAPLLRRI